MNLYAYVGNNPVNYYDPSGYESSQKTNGYETGNGKVLPVGVGAKKYDGIDPDSYTYGTYEGEGNPVTNNGLDLYNGVQITKFEGNKMYLEDGSIIDTQMMNPNNIRYSQTSVNGAAEIIDSMKLNGWDNTKSPIDIVKMSDGQYTTLDNTRVLAGNYAGTNVRTVIHGPDDLLNSDDLIERFKYKNKSPVTWGDATKIRIYKQGSKYRNIYPSGSWITGLDGGSYGF